MEQPLATTTLLLERLKSSRDDEAWTAFDQRFRGVIHAAALRLGLPDQDAADAAQETILQALRDYQAGKYDRARGRLSSWIIGIAHHRIIDLLRARRRDAQRAGSLTQGEEPSVEQLTQAFDQSLERRIFEQAWERLRSGTKLAPHTLLAFELTALRGLSPEAAATQCGITIDQVYVARNRVSALLREAVEQVSRAFHEGL